MNYISFVIISDLDKLCLVNSIEQFNCSESDYQALPYTGKDIRGWVKKPACSLSAFRKRSLTSSSSDGSLWILTGILKNVFDNLLIKENENGYFFLFKLASKLTVR